MRVFIGLIISSLALTVYVIWLCIETGLSFTESIKAVILFAAYSGFLIWFFWKDYMRYK